jgi:hypothetical protein
MLILSCELACFGVDNASFAFTHVALSDKWAQLSDLVGEIAAEDAVGGLRQLELFESGLLFPA